jgi:hypothetical protein|tara:strand:+ start:1221 stop:1604 length:384 start_codon:yes stop_codon:yes gene_type:complete
MSKDPTKRLHSKRVTPKKDLEENGEEEYYDFDSFKEVFLSNIPDELESTDEGKEWLRRRREETLDTEGLFVAYTDSGEAHFVPTIKFLDLPTLMRLDILKDWIMGLTSYYSLVGEDWLKEIEEQQND